MQLILILCLLREIVTSEKYFAHPRPGQKGFISQVSYEGTNFGNVMSKLKSGNKNNSSMVQTVLTCQTSSNICDHVSQTFNTAGMYLSNIIKFKSPVTVQASFFSFCKTQNDCSTNQITLGQASASHSVAIVDDDGQERLYPQSLVKQLDININFKLAPFDIIAEFNSDAHFWFPSSGGAPRQNQVDFLLVVAHELLHGLGFASSYNDYFTDNDPAILTPSPDLGRDSKGGLVINGFYENAFDKHLTLLNQNQALSEVSKQFNGFANSTRVYNDSRQIQESFSKSAQYSLGRSMLELATTPGSLAFILDNPTVTSPNATMWLETGLSPFSVGSSLSHVGFKQYSNTQDFLMRYEMSPGISLASVIRKVGSWGSEPYGPTIVSALGRMGYKLNTKPDPLVLVTYPSHSTAPISPYFTSLLLIAFMCFL